ncbi:hypothetical protein [Ralstonia pseudosolanacearum]|uniref:hypothetical protein n=1 Tax=Ralstonia pseudosolanacearum TaxID=1310165 RepID=UPI003CE7E953
MSRFQKQKNQQGFAVLAALIIAVVLVGALTQMVALSDTMGLRNQAFGNAAAQVAAQADFIRTRVLLCGSDYPDGNNGTAYRPALPGGTPSIAATAMVCPGTGQNLWVGTDGVTLPPSPKFMTSGWWYANDATSARIAIGGDQTTLNMAATRLGSNAIVTAGTPATLTYTVSN